MHKTKKITQKNKIKNYMHPFVKDQLEDAYKSIEEEKRQCSGSLTVSIEKLHEVPQIDESDLKEKCEKLFTENSKLIKDNKILKKLLEESKSIILQKEIKIKKLLSQVHTNSNTVNLFEEYEQYFSNLEIKKLRSIQKGQAKDSTFVTKCLDYLYGGKQNLLERVATDVKVPVGKKPFSPEKVAIITKMLQERLNSEGISDELTANRFGRLRELLNNAICTARKAKPTQHLVESTPIKNHVSSKMSPLTPITSIHPSSAPMLQMPYSPSGSMHSKISNLNFKFYTF